MNKVKSLEYLNKFQNSFLEDLFDLIRIPSVTRDNKSVQEAANWLEKRLKQTADFVQQIPTQGNPVVVAEWKPQTLITSSCCQVKISGNILPF